MKISIKDIVIIVLFGYGLTISILYFQEYTYSFTMFKKSDLIGVFSNLENPSLTPPKNQEYNTDSMTFEEEMKLR